MQPLNIFVVHASDTLTDHLPNGAGWIDYNYLRGLAERGHTLHVVTPRAELRDPLPSNLHLHLVTGPESDAKRADPTRGGRRPGLRKRLHYMSSVRRLLQDTGQGHTVRHRAAVHSRGDRPEPVHAGKRYPAGARAIFRLVVARGRGGRRSRAASECA